MLDWKIGKIEIRGVGPYMDNLNFLASYLVYGSAVLSARGMTPEAAVGALIALDEAIHGAQ